MCLTEPRKSLRFFLTNQDLQKLPRGDRFVTGLYARLLKSEVVALLCVSFGDPRIENAKFACALCFFLFFSRPSCHDGRYRYRLE